MLHELQIASFWLLLPFDSHGPILIDMSLKSTHPKRLAKKKSRAAPAASAQSALIVGKALLAKAKPNKALVAAFRQFPHLIPQ
jgi:hypothetical protein